MRADRVSWQLVSAGLPASLSSVVRRPHDFARIYNQLQGCCVVLPLDSAAHHCRNVCCSSHRAPSQRSTYGGTAPHQLPDDGSVELDRNPELRQELHSLESHTGNVLGSYFWFTRLCRLEHVHFTRPESLSLTKITRANAGGPSRLPTRTRWAARIAHFCR
jgi:hypothetical protein